jgi:hypothetical protein
MTNPADVAAYIGAAAWIPQIFRWGYKAYAKPIVTIIPNKQIELGYTTFGPILNIRLGLAVERKDVILNEIYVTVRHSDHDTHVLTWMGMSEKFSEISDEMGKKQVVERSDDAIALKLSTLMLTQKFVRFQDTEFHQEVASPMNEATAHQSYLMKAEPNYHDKLMASEQVHKLVEEYKKHFWWKAGKYSIHFQIRSPFKVNLSEKSFDFELLQDDIDALRQNLDLLRPAIENQIKLGLTGYTPKPLPWVWRNPKLSPKR